MGRSKEDALNMRRKFRCIECIKIVVIVTAMLWWPSMNGIAAEKTGIPSDAMEEDAVVFPDREDENKDILPEAAGQKTVGGDTLSVELPVIAEGAPSPFDFILDPCGLLYGKDAVCYGGGTVEERATMLFRTKAGEYDFSKCSDMLSIVNHGEDAVIVTLSASVSDLEGIALMGQEDFSGNESPAMYIAVKDDRGNVQPISTEETSVIQVELGTGIYSFGLTGACNPDADWSGVNVHPKITVKLHVEAMALESESEAEEKIEQSPGESTAEPELGKENSEELSSEDAFSTEEPDGTTEPSDFDSESLADHEGETNGDDIDSSDSSAEYDDIQIQDESGDVSEEPVLPGGVTDDEADLGDDKNPSEERLSPGEMEGSKSDPAQSEISPETPESLENLPDVAEEGPDGTTEPSDSDSESLADNEGEANGDDIDSSDSSAEYNDIQIQDESGDVSEEPILPGGVTDV